MSREDSSSTRHSSPILIREALFVSQTCFRFFKASTEFSSSVYSIWIEDLGVPDCAAVAKNDCLRSRGDMEGSTNLGLNW